ncbi:MAG TPA: hypothetical protein VHD90_10140 [Phototrophicaceae bacterium]|nr:hypothetical protein [Phototrophicaceae bacterium]
MPPTLPNSILKMAIKNTKRLIVDSDVMQAAGYKNEPPSSKICREVLTTILNICHRVVLTETLQEEWSRHAEQSAFSRYWQVEMAGRHEKLLAVRNSTRNRPLLDKLDQVVTDENIKARLRKDIHLVEAALLADKIVISMNERDRNHFHSYAGEIEELRQIMWVNPTNSNEEVIEWLREGAKLDRTRCLGYIPHE